MRPGSTLHCHHLVTNIRFVDTEITAHIALPEAARGLVIFCEGLPKTAQPEGTAEPVACKNPIKSIAEHLNEAGFATLTGPLLAVDESARNPRSGETCSGLDLLERRLIALTDWIAMQRNLQQLPAAYFGSGAGAEAAIIAATRRPEIVRSIVACAPDLDRVEAFLHEVFAPTLLVFGGEDAIWLNRQRFRMLQFPQSTPTELLVCGGPRNPSETAASVAAIIPSVRKWYEKFPGQTRAMAAV